MTFDVIEDDGMFSQHNNVKNLKLHACESIENHHHHIDYHQQTRFRKPHLGHKPKFYMGKA
jgi:hypothetical protein